MGTTSIAFKHIDIYRIKQADFLSPKKQNLRRKEIQSLRYKSADAL